jgi:hypothetical protein
MRQQGKHQTVRFAGNAFDDSTRGRGVFNPLKYGASGGGMRFEPLKRLPSSETGGDGLRCQPAMQAQGLGRYSEVTNGFRRGRPVMKPVSPVAVVSGW